MFSFLQLKQLPVKVRVFLKSPTKSSQDGRASPRPVGLESATATGDGTSSQMSWQKSRPTAADVIPGVVQRLQLKHQQSLEKDDEGNLRVKSTPDATENDGGRPRTRSFSLRTEKKRVTSTSSEPESTVSSTASSEAAAAAAAAATASSKALSPVTRRTSRTVTKDPKVGLNIIKETTILTDGDEEDAPLAQLDELKQFYSFEGVLEIKYTKITRTRTGDATPSVPYKYTRTSVTASPRSTSPSVSPRSLSPTFTQSPSSKSQSRPVTPTFSEGTQTIAFEEPCTASSVNPQTTSTPTRFAIPRTHNYCELDSDSDNMMDTDGDSSTLSTPSDASLEYVRLLTPEDDYESEEEIEEELQRASYQSVASTSYDSLAMSPPPEWDSARSMSESSSLTSVTMLPSPVSWSVPLRESDIAEDMLSSFDAQFDAQSFGTPCTDAPVSGVSAENIHEPMQEFRIESDNDSGVDHGEGRFDDSFVVEEQVTRNTTDEVHQEASHLGATANPNEVSKTQKTLRRQRSVDEQSVGAPKQVTKSKDSKTTTPLPIRKHTPPFTSDRIPFTTAASSWPFRIRPASMTFQFNRRYLGRSGHGNALMMLFGPLVYNPNFPWHDALVTLKVPRHIIKDMNAHMAICSAQEKKKKTVRILDTIGRPGSKELDDDPPREDEGSDVDAGVEAVLVVEVQDHPRQTSSSGASASTHKGKKSKPKDPQDSYSFTKTPPKKDDGECIIL